MNFLLIIWLFIAYFANGFIIFGPRQEYLKHSGTEMLKTTGNLYSNNSYFLFYAGKDPNYITSTKDAEYLSKDKNFYYAYRKSRKVDLSEFWKKQNPIYSFSNPRGDKVLIYHFNNK